MHILSKVISVIVTIISLPIQLVFWIFLFLKANFGSNRVTIEDFDIAESGKNLKYDDGVLSIDYNDFNAEEIATLQKELALEHGFSDFPKHDSDVKHAYTLDFVGDENICPRCSISTERRNADFIYSAGTEIRVMYIPAGYFCVNCPTVIVDINMMKKGVTKNHHFKNLIGIDFEDDINLFSTFNGESSVYISDGEQTILAQQLSDIPTHNQSSKRGNKKRKRKLQKSSRKKNRPKK